MSILDDFLYWLFFSLNVSIISAPFYHNSHNNGKIVQCPSFTPAFQIVFL